MADKLLAEWFWIDRWVGSSAFLLPLEARGLYREMLTQAWRRGGRLPNDPEQIRRACGVTVEEWGRTWPFVSEYWRVDGAELINDTQTAVLAQSQRRAEKQRAWRARRAGNATGNGGGSLSLSPSTKIKAKAWRWSSLYVSPKMHKTIADALGKRAEGVDWDKLYEAAACDYAEHGEPADRLRDLKARARKAADARIDLLSGPPSAEDTRKYLDKIEAMRKAATA